MYKKELEEQIRKYPDAISWNTNAIIVSLRNKDVTEEEKEELLQSMKSTKIEEIKKIENKKITIKLGRTAEREIGTVQNIQVYLEDKLIIDSNNSKSAYIYIIFNKTNEKKRISVNDKKDFRYITKNQAYVGDISLPTEYRGTGLAKRIYQAIANTMHLEIVKGDTISILSTDFWKKQESFKPE